jgi:hypothetical protein
MVGSVVISSGLSTEEIGADPNVHNGVIGGNSLVARTLGGIGGAFGGGST